MKILGNPQRIHLEKTDIEWVRKYIPEAPSRALSFTHDTLAECGAEIEMIFQVKIGLFPLNRTYVRLFCLTCAGMITIAHYNDVKLKLIEMVNEVLEEK